MYVVFGKGEEIHDILIRNGYDYPVDICQDFLDDIDPDYDIGTSDWEDRIEMEEELADKIAKDIEDFLETVEEEMNDYDLEFTFVPGLDVHIMYEEIYDMLFKDVLEG